MNDEAVQQDQSEDLVENTSKSGSEANLDSASTADHSSSIELDIGEMSPAEFQSLTESAEESSSLQNDDLNLNVILDVPVTISMEIGRTRINIRNLLQLNQGSVVELDRLAGEPMDVLVNGTLIAHGEVVVVNDKFGIRLTDVISPAERVKKLQ